MMTTRSSHPEPRTTVAVRVPVDRVSLAGDLESRGEPRGIVVFAHGSGSSRYSPRNQHVARRLQDEGFATLLIDLLTEDEEALDQRTGHLRFNIDLLARRLVSIVDWLQTQARSAKWPVGLFGASTGGGAALVAAADRPRRVAAVVSRGGRPDLAGPALDRVVAPTLLVVGGGDGPVIQLNRAAMSRMRGEVTLHIVPGATHLFEEPGALDEVSSHAAAWFGKYLVHSPRESPDE